VTLGLKSIGGVLASILAICRVAYSQPTDKAVYVRVSSRDFVDRLLYAGKTNDPRNRTNPHETQQATDERSSSSFDTDSKWPSQTRHDARRGNNFS
jgi:hypothetical protein